MGKTAPTTICMVLALVAPASLLLAAPVPQGERLVSVGSLALPRAAHTATLLASGRVLVTGGCVRTGCEGATRSTELFLPARGRFVAGPRLRHARVGHAALRLRTGEVLVAGGWVGREPTATVELYEPTTRRFVITAGMLQARGGLTSTLLRDGRVLIAGGDDGGGSLATAEVFDPVTRTFSRTGSMAIPRAAHAAALLADDRVAVFGGSGTNGQVTDSIEIWDPRDGRFHGGGVMKAPRHKLGGVALTDGTVLLVGGSDDRDFGGRTASAELYDPTQRTTTLLPDMAGPRFKLLDAVVRLRNGTVLVAGGNAAVERYEPRSARFTLVGSVDADRAFATATVLRDGRVLLVGGYDPSIAPTRRAWLYTPRMP